MKDICPYCGSDIRIRHGRYGEFLGCIRYPKCTWTTSVSEWDDANNDAEQWRVNRELGYMDHLVDDDEWGDR